MKPNRPKDAPHRIPAWAWRWLAWRTNKKPKPEPKPKPGPKLPLQGCDYVSGPTPAQLKAAGMQFVCRYIAPPGTTYDWKRLRTTEAVGLHRAGLNIVLVFESSAKRATGGSVAGTQDAKYALAELKRLGAPAGTVVYFACDFDAPDYAPKSTSALKKLGPVAHYFDALNKGLGSAAKVGVYGGYWPVARLLNAGLVEWAWQTYAWSGGSWDHRAQLQQYANGKQIGAKSVDLDRAVHYPYGGW